MKSLVLAIALVVAASAAGEWWSVNYQVPRPFFCHVSKGSPAATIEGLRKEQKEFLRGLRDVFRIIDDGDRVEIEIKYSDGSSLISNEYFRTQARCEADLKKRMDEIAREHAAREAKERDEARKLDKYR